jgi:hypothetical protein
MKNFFTVLLLVFLFGCKESGVKIAKPSTFVHYFNGGTPDFAQSIINTSDGGYLILANSQTALTSTYYRIKLIKVDKYGNELWQSLIPKPPGKTDPPAPSYRGFGITAITDNSGDTGYLIVGDQIYDDSNSNQTHGLLMIQVDNNGAVVNSGTKTTTDIGFQVQGVGVALSSTAGNYYVLGKILANSGPDDMFLSEVNGSTFAPVWKRTFPGSSSGLVNRVFTYGDSIYWGGTRNTTPTEARWVSANVNTVSSSDRSYPSGEFINPPTGLPVNFSCNDICQFGFGYGFVGSYGISANEFHRIAFFRIDAKGNMLDSASFGLKFPQSYQTGNSICSTQDGGFLILGTTGTDISTSDTNYILIKTDVHGTKQWDKQYGGRYFDIGSKVLQASDGGFIVLGTTTLANVQSIFLMKTDASGNIE